MSNIPAKENGMHIYSVSELNLDIKRNLESGFSDVWVEGEVSNYYCHNNRHFYFDLKDEYSKIKVVMFYEANKNLVFQIENGLHLIISGYLSLYEKRGEYQLIATSIRPVGRGELILAYEQLKEKLEAKGYFAAEFKKKIPALPKMIGVVTSTGGAVLKDIITVLSRRFNNFHLIVSNVNVGGISSQEEVCQAIDDLCSHGVDVIIVARGGGSLEDMWAFNTEIVAEKVFQCRIPVISAIGHETDFTICDFVADCRAATPSVAAQIVIIDKNEAMENIMHMAESLKSYAENKLSASRKELKFLIERRIFRKPGTMLLDLWQEVENLKKSLFEKASSNFRSKHQNIGSILLLLNVKQITDKMSLKKSFVKNLLLTMVSEINKNFSGLKNKTGLLIKDLQANSPVSVLEKGYAIILKKDTATAVRHIADIEIGQEADIVLKDGILLTKVLNKISKKLGAEV